MKQKNNLAIILAAGKGSRMKKKIPKPLNKVYDKPILNWIVSTFRSCNIDIAVVINPDKKKKFNKYNNDVLFIYQNNPLGTGHAVIQAKKVIEKYNKVFVFVGDSPFITSSIIRKMLLHHNKEKADCSILSSCFKRKFPYARIIRKNNTLFKVVEENNATEQEKKTNELFASHYLFNTKTLHKYIDRLQPNPISGEINLTDIINILIENNKKINVIKINDWRKLIGLNTQEDILWIESQKMI